MKVYIVRHGESETNVQKKWTGWLDALLTEKGISDAKRAGELLSSIVFDKVYASDLTRAVQTAKTALPNCEIETNFLLREIDVGSFAGQPLNNLSSFSEEQLKNYNTTAFKAFGGESLQDFNLSVYGNFGKV